MSAQSKETTQSEIQACSIRLGELHDAINRMHVAVLDGWHCVLVSMEKSWLGPAIDELGDGFRISYRPNTKDWDIETKVGDEWKRVVHYIEEFENPEDRVAYIETLKDALVDPYSELLLARTRELITFAERDLYRLTTLWSLGKDLRNQFPE